MDLSAGSWMNMSVGWLTVKMIHLQMICFLTEVKWLVCFSPEKDKLWSVYKFEVEHKETEETSAVGDILYHTWYAIDSRLQVRYYVSSGWLFCMCVHVCVGACACACM